MTSSFSQWVSDTWVQKLDSFDKEVNNWIMVAQIRAWLLSVRHKSDQPVKLPVGAKDRIVEFLGYSFRDPDECSADQMRRHVFVARSKRETEERAAFSQQSGSASVSSFSLSAAHVELHEIVPKFVRSKMIEAHVLPAASRGEESIDIRIAKHDSVWVRIQELDRKVRRRAGDNDSITLHLRSLGYTSGYANRTHSGHDYLPATYYTVGW